ncbi:MAG: hypothetical protein IT318_07665 [Anaerolineales bacterium]|nr:hypothetical protein [Anaerolineales bacterium]
MSHRLQRLSTVGLYALAVGSLLLTGWSAWRLARHPHAGITWSYVTGLIETVDPRGPAAGRLHPGERLLAIDGLAPNQALFYPGKLPGDSVIFLVQRNGESHSVVVELTQPAAMEIAGRLSPLFVALVFGSVGAVILAFNVSLLSVLFFLFCQMSAAVLASGAASPIGPLWAVQLFNGLLWWLGPVIIHLHLYFPAKARLWHAPVWVGLLYVAAALGGLLDLAANPIVLRTAVPALYSLRRLWLTGTLLVAVCLLIWTFRSTPSAQRRQQVGIVALGGVLSLVPFLTLSLLPDALLRQPFWPYEFSFLFLSLLPLAYGYAILHYRLVQLDRYVSRGAASALVLALLAGLYLILSAVLMRLIPANLLQAPAVNLVMILVLAVVFHPLHRLLSMGVSRVFYGGWYDYRSAVQKISLATGRTADPSMLAHKLSQEIQAAMQLEGACLLVRETRSDPGVTTVVGLSCTRTGAGSLRLEMGRGILEYFKNDPRPVEAEKLRRAVAGRRLNGEARPCLTCPYAQLWLPLPGQEFPSGLLILDAKRGGGTFDTRDREILEVVARQAGIALQNARLIAELEKRALESAQLHRQVVRAREDERKRVARELHDEIIQPLVGLKFQLAEMRASAGQGTDGSSSRWPKEEIQRVVDDVRRICADLRPPALDTLGLASAVRARVREVGRQGALQIRLSIEGDEERELPEELSVCMYRILQEALLNVQKHAAARQVRVSLRIGPDEVSLTVEDDGRGFETPLQLNRLVGAGHFGLAGARERLRLVNGRLEISSTPPHGARLVARAPLAEHVGVSPTQREQ